MMQKAVLGNIGTIIVFRVQAEDAEVLAKELYTGTRESHGKCTARLKDLPNFHFYYKFGGEDPKVARTINPG